MSSECKGKTEEAGESSPALKKIEEKVLQWVIEVSEREKRLLDTQGQIVQHENRLQGLYNTEKVRKEHLESARKRKMMAEKEYLGSFLNNIICKHVIN